MPRNTARARGGIVAVRLSAVLRVASCARPVKSGAMQALDIELAGPHLPTPFRTLRDPHAAAAAALEERIVAFERAVAAHHGWAVDAVNTGSVEDVHVVGRVCCDALGKAALTEASILLEGSRATSQGARVKLDVSLLSDVSLFAGQVCAVRGRNPTGACVTAHAIVDALPYDAPVATGGAAGAARIVVAAGPFVRSGAHTFEALHAVLSYCAEHAPAALVLAGPFVPDSHATLPQLRVTFQELFEKEVRGLRAVTYYMHWDPLTTEQPAPRVPHSSHAHMCSRARCIPATNLGAVARAGGGAAASVAGGAPGNARLPAARRHRRTPPARAPTAALCRRRGSGDAPRAGTPRHRRPQDQHIAQPGGPRARLQRVGEDGARRDVTSCSSDA